MSTKTALVLVLGFIAGCSALALAPLVIPSARAQATTRWEVQCVPVERQLIGRIVGELNDAGNRLGAQGWELVSAPGSIATGNQVACFKRPIR